MHGLPIFETAVKQRTGWDVVGANSLKEEGHTSDKSACSSLPGVASWEPLTSSLLGPVRSLTRARMYGHTPYVSTAVRRWLPTQAGPCAVVLSHLASTRSLSPGPCLQEGLRPHRALLLPHQAVEAQL